MKLEPVWTEKRSWEACELIRLESFRWEARGIHRVSMKISLVFFFIFFFFHRARAEEVGEVEEEEMASENQTR